MGLASLVNSMKKKSTPTYPRRAQDAFVNQKMLYKVRDELKSFITSEIHSLKSDIHAVKSDIHRIALLMEEQNNRNKTVLDGLSHLFGRQDRLETEFRK